jgi:hypothetical protein
MKRGLILLAVILAALLSPKIEAQILDQVIKPLDRSKQADVNEKTLSFGDVPMNTLSQPLKDLPGSPLSKGDLKLEQLDQKKAEFNTLPMNMNTVPTPSLPQANFNTQSAAADVPSDKTTKQAEEVKKKKTPITERQIKPFTPAGEEELKHQLNDPPQR